MDTGISGLYRSKKLIQALQKFYDSPFKEDKRFVV